MGAVLGQWKEGKVHAICCASKTLNEAQVNYATTEKELLEVVLLSRNSYHTLLIRKSLSTWIMLLLSTSYPRKMLNQG